MQIIDELEKIVEEFILVELAIYLLMVTWIRIVIRTGIIKTNFMFKWGWWFMIVILNSSIMKQ